MKEKDKGKIVGKHYDWIYNMVYVMVGNEDDAGEITQEAFARYLDRGYKNPAQLYQIAKNLSRDYLKNRKRPLVIPNEELDAIKSDVVTPFEALNKYYLRKTVRTAVLGLSEKHMEVIVLYYYSNLSIREISEILGITEKAVKGRLHRARKKLKKTLSNKI